VQHADLSVQFVVCDAVWCGVVQSSAVQPRTLCRRDSACPQFGVHCSAHAVDPALDCLSSAGSLTLHEPSVRS
jgi:hypothetical protein